MVLLSKTEQQESVMGAVDMRKKPVWEGPQKVEPFRYSRDFLKAFTKFQVRHTQYIKTKDVQEFINMFFGDFKNNNVDSLFLKKFMKRYITFFTHAKNQWIDMFDLHLYLRPFFIPSVFGEVRGRLKYSSVDVMQIWTFYNRDHTMAMDDEEVEEFVFDMLSDTKQRCNPKIIECVTQKLLSLSGETQITLRGITKILPLEGSIMTQYENIQQLNPDEITRVLAFYDQNDEGVIDGCELYALIRDVLEANGHKDPYNMEVILSTQEFLNKEGALRPSGALDFSRTQLLFSLGTNVTSL